MKRILVPTDFSQHATKALDYALGMASTTGAEVLLIHVCELIHSPFADRAQMINEYNDLKTAELTERLQLLKEQREKSNVAITVKLYDGEIIDSILFAGAQEHVDLIVMGTLGATGIKSIFFGTKTAAVISQSTIPVLAIPPGYVWKEPKTLLFAINNDEESALLKPANELAKSFGSKLKVAIFSQESARADRLMESSRTIHKAFQKIEKECPDNDVEYLHLSGPDFYEELHQCIDKEGVDLLVMITHQRTMMQEIFKFSMTRKMAYHTKVPLLALHSTRSL